MAALRSTREIVVWSEVAEVLERKIEAALTDAADAPDMRSMGFAQGQLSAFREMKHLPQAMLAGAEMQAAEEKNRAAVRRSQHAQNWRNPDAIGNV